MSIGVSSRQNDDEIVDIIRLNTPGKRQAENQLFARYAYFVDEGIKKYSLTEEDAFSAYADTILNALESISKSLFEKRSSLKTYLYKVFQNKCVDLIRKKTTNKRSIHQTAPVTDMLEMISDQAKTIIEQIIDKTDRHLLRQRLAEIGENCRKLLLYFADGFKDREIAVFMDYKAASVVKTSRLRCLEKLRLLYLKT